MTSIIPPKVYDTLKMVVKGDIENFIITVDDPNKKGDGFLSQLFFISLKNKHNGEQLNLVVKLAFEDQDIRKLHPIKKVFENEIWFYTKLWPKFVEIQDNIPPSNRFYHLPKCFAATAEDNYERLVLENLKYEGFAMYDKKKAFEKDHFELIFKTYGKFHALSLAFKARNPEEFRKMTSNMTDMWIDAYQNQKGFSDNIKTIHEECLSCLQPGEDDAVIQSYKKYLVDGVQIFRESLVLGKNVVLKHGDCWSNNLMFKYDNNSKPIDLRILDFQMVCLGSPVHDLSYSLYSGGTKEIYDQLDYFLQIYHDSLSQSLRACGCDPEELYPMKELRNDWKLYCHMGMTMALMIWRGKLVYDDDVVDLADISNDEVYGDKFFQAKFDEVTFRERIRDIIFHFYENDYLL